MDRKKTVEVNLSVCKDENISQETFNLICEFNTKYGEEQMCYALKREMLNIRMNGRGSFTKNDS